MRELKYSSSLNGVANKTSLPTHCTLAQVKGVRALSELMDIASAHGRGLIVWITGRYISSRNQFPILKHVPCWLGCYICAGLIPAIGYLPCYVLSRCCLNSLPIQNRSSHSVAVVCNPAQCTFDPRTTSPRWIVLDNRNAPENVLKTLVIFNLGY